MEKIKAIECTKYGPPEVLKLKEVNKPIPKNNEALIKVYASTVSTGDCRIRRFEFAKFIGNITIEFRMRYTEANKRA